MSQNEFFYAWLAGFIDGEGTITINRSGTGYSPFLVVTNTNQAILKEIASVLGVGCCVARGDTRRGATRLPVYQYYAYGQDALLVIRRVYSHLRVKQPRADLVLAFPIAPRAHRGAPVPQSIREEQARIYTELAALNQRGVVSMEE